MSAMFSFRHWRFASLEISTEICLMPRCPETSIVGEASARIRLNPGIRVGFEKNPSVHKDYRKWTYILMCVFFIFRFVFCFYFKSLKIHLSLTQCGSPASRLLEIPPWFICSWFWGGADRIYTR